MIERFQVLGRWCSCIRRGNYASDLVAFLNISAFGMMLSD